MVILDGSVRRAQAPALDLPPPFSLVPLREAGDAHAHACEIAAEAGAGTLVWTRRFDVAEFAVVLEPDEAPESARRAITIGMNALADTLVAFAPPEMAVAVDWPDAIRVDGVLVGGARLGWPSLEETQAPGWLVFSAVIRTAVMRAGDPGLRPLLGALDELGFEAIDAGEIVAAFARHLMAGFHDCQEQGFEAAAQRFEARSLPSASRTGESETALREALRAPSWRDPATGMPWL